MEANWSLYLFILIPLLLANVIHMFIVRWNVFEKLKKPVNTKWFGTHKTWRGFVVLMALNAGMTILINLLFVKMNPIKALGIGALLGLTYMVSELPNSYMKRRLGIPPGESPKINKWIFVLIDKADSTLGVLLVCKVLFEFRVAETAVLLVIATGIHTLVSYLLKIAGIKKSL